MKSFSRRTAGLLVLLAALSLLISSFPYAAATAQSGKSPKFKIKPQQRTKPPLRRAGNGYNVKKGAEIAAKVKKLRGSSREVQAALKLFEDKKRPPKVDSAFALTGKLSQQAAGRVSTGRTIERVSFTQSSAIVGTDVELIFVPVLSDDMEWHGTVISNLYDSSGANVGQYVAEPVLIMPDPNLYAWDEVYEAPVYGGMVQSPIAEPGMYINVDLGVPLSQQQYSRDLSGSDSTGAIRAVGTSSFQSGRAVIREWANCAFGWCG